MIRDPERHGNVGYCSGDKIGMVSRSSPLIKLLWAGLVRGYWGKRFRWARFWALHEERKRHLQIRAS